MYKEIELDGKGWARGRNGYFVPRKVEIFKTTRGQVDLEVWSRRRGKVEPLFLRFSKEEAENFARQVLSLLGVGAEPHRVAVMMDGGVIQEVLANQPGIQVAVIDYDTDGADPKETKRVLQDDGDGKKWYEPAFVELWGEASFDAKFTRRFFRNTAAGREG